MEFVGDAIHDTFHDKDGEEHTLVVEGVLDFVELAAFLVGRDEVFAPILNPLYRFAQVDCCKRRENLFWVEQHNFRPEAATYIRRNDSYFVFGKLEYCSQAIA